MQALHKGCTRYSENNQEPPQMTAEQGKNYTHPKERRHTGGSIRPQPHKKTPGIAMIGSIRCRCIMGWYSENWRVIYVQL